MNSKSALTAFVLMIMTFSAFAVFAPPAKAEGDYIVLSEDFEDGWDENWSATDYNTDAGLDYWGTTGYREHAGSASAWCARVGTSSVNSYSNSYNHFYDQDMQAVLQAPIQDVSGFDTVTLTFYYWAETGTLYLYDYLEVRVWNGAYWNRIWKQTSVDTDNLWEQVTVDLPLDTVWICFSFISDGLAEDVPGFGPYEGVYLDTVEVLGWDSTPPTSTVTDLDAYHASEMIYITYTAVDSGGSDVQYVELYYRLEGAGTYSVYSTPSNPDGKWFPELDPMIPFNCTYANGTGAYDFYTVAMDVAGNAEAPPAAAQASTVIDLAPPVTILTVNGHQWEDDGWLNETATIDLEAVDSGSGIERTLFRVGSGTWEEFEGPLLLAEGVLDISFYSVDMAGNAEAAKTFAIQVDSEAPTATISVADDATKVENSTVSLVWTSEDDGSGIDRCLIKVDDRAFEYFSSDSGSVDMSGLENGDHTATLRAFDNAGNFVEVNVSFDVDLGGSRATSLEGDDIGWIIAGVVVAMAAIAVTLLIRFHLKSSR